MRTMVGEQLLHSLPYAAILTAFLVGLLCFFIFHKTNSRKNGSKIKPIAPEILP